MATSTIAAPRTGLFSDLPRTFWIVAAGTLANRIGTMVVPFLVFFLGAQGVSTSATGTIVVALGFGGAAGSVAGGWLADRIGPRSALIVGLVAAPAALGALYVAPTIALMTVAAVLVGLTGKLYPPAANALVAASVTGERRTRAFSLMHWAFNIGAAGAAAMAGFLAAHGYALLFAIDGITCLIFAVIAAMFLPRVATARRANERGGYGVLFADRLMLAFIGLDLAQEIVYSLTEYAIPLSIRLDNLSPAVFGAVAVVNAVLVVLLQPVLYPRLARFGRLQVLAGAWIVVGVGIGTTGLVHTPVGYALSAAIWSVGEVAAGIVAGGIAADLAPAHAQGRYQGAMIWAGSLARLAGPALTTFLFAYAGPGAVWWTAALTGVIGALLLARLMPALRTRLATPA
ncbi:MFS family permease [Hamadaea flava]|uniref:MFS transporter n=1 Tax=Hamadaea flava TaxID=1742688 RepID=A0ABV8LJY1_9ACTN|nr:MFS transporter [Hamadaea flava]MCP2323733.1 MFS family permease [Hamadaea flava]